MSRKRVKVATDRFLSPPPLSVYDPDWTRYHHGPEVAPFLVAGVPYQLVAWTAEQWDRLPEDRRPGDACRGSHGNWYRFVPEDDRPDRSG